MLYKTIVLLIIAIILAFSLQQDMDPTYCRYAQPLFLNETFEYDKAPTLGVAVYNRQVYTIEELVRLVNGSTCSSQDLPPELLTLQYPLQVYCLNGKFIFANSRSIGESCLGDEHCSSSPTRPVRCIQNQCQSVQATLLQQDANCSIKSYQYGYICGSGLACDTESSQTCQPLCNSTKCNIGYDCAYNDWNEKVCVKLKNLGESCSSSTLLATRGSNCVDGTYCKNIINATCVPQGRAGEPCSVEDNSCIPEYECYASGDIIGVEGVCRALPKVGEECGTWVSHCQNISHVYCPLSTNETPSVCTLRSDIGSLCIATEQCISGLCFFANETRTCVQTLSLGQPCQPNVYPCEEGLFCNPTEYAPNFDSINDDFSAFRCEAQLPRDGSLCVPRIGCAQGFSCAKNDFPPMCYENRQMGQSCVHSIQCPSSSCENGICSPAKKLGQDCNGNNSTHCEPPLLCSFGKCIQPYSVTEGQRCNGETYPKILYTTDSDFPIYHECELQTTCYKGRCTKHAPCNLYHRPLVVECQCTETFSAAVYNCYFEMQNYTLCLQSTGQVERADLPLIDCNEQRTNYYECKFAILRDLFPERQLGQIPNLLHQTSSHFPLSKVAPIQFYNTASTVSQIVNWITLILLSVALILNF